MADRDVAHDVGRADVHGGVSAAKAISQGGLACADRTAPTTTILGTAEAVRMLSPSWSLIPPDPDRACELGLVCTVTLMPRTTRWVLINSAITSQRPPACPDPIRSGASTHRDFFRSK